MTAAGAGSGTTVTDGGEAAGAGLCAGGGKASRSGLVMTGAGLVVTESMTAAVSRRSASHE